MIKKLNQILELWEAINWKISPNLKIAISHCQYFGCFEIKNVSQTNTDTGVPKYRIFGVQLGKLASLAVAIFSS